MKFPHVTSLLLLLAVGVRALPGNPVTDQIDTAIEDHTERAVTEQVEQSVQQSVEESVAESVNDAVEQSVSDAAGQQVEENIEQSVEETVSETVESSVGDSVSETVAHGVEESVSGNVEQTVNESVGVAVQETVDQAVGGGVAETVSRAGEVLDDALNNPGIGGGGSAGDEPRPVLSASGEVLFHEIVVEDGWRAVAREWLVAVDAGDLEKLKRRGITVVETRELKGLEMTVVRFRTDDKGETREILRDILPAAVPADRNHIYDYRPQSGGETSGEPYSHTRAVCDDPVRIGMVDTAVNLEHPFLGGARIEQKNFAPSATVSDSSHGSAIAGILVARGEGVSGVTPNAALAAAAVMYGRGDGSQGATAMSLISALDWLAEREVDVINLSLAGPPNGIVEEVLGRISARGVTVVSAVGNGGPASPPLYPAAYPNVIGVTAVDGEGRVYRWANRGAQVDFSAPGVNVRTLDGGGGVTTDSGTSLAAPVVSAHAACLKPVAGAGGLDNALADRALDLGDPGRDDTFGIGLLEVNGVPRESR